MAAKGRTSSEILTPPYSLHDLWTKGPASPISSSLISAVPRPSSPKSDRWQVLVGEVCDRRPSLAQAGGAEWKWAC
eukprot:scaffold48_cov311-Pinguiococcus_pyrenoidosus.AAC.97